MTEQNTTTDTENLDVETPEEVEPTVDETTEQDRNSDEQEEATEEEQETFDRPYVEGLRREAADARVRARRADDLATALWTAQVTATGRLADPTDLAMPDDADPLDPESVTAAVDELLERRPHLASRRPRGDVGQGAGGTGGGTVDLAGIMRGLAS